MEDRPITLEEWVNKLGEGHPAYAEYQELVDRAGRLFALEAGGVDNWEWYDECISEYYKDKGK